MKKNAVSVICAFALAAGCLPLRAEAKVIEPEVVKTEKWTTSYYIDDDMETLYPYVQCEADIYNDGSIKLYMWNTHEWDGFTTVKHQVTLAETEPIMPTSMAYAFKFNLPYPQPQQDFTPTDSYFPITESTYNAYKENPSSVNESFSNNSEWTNANVNYVPAGYALYKSDITSTSSYSGQQSLSVIFGGQPSGNQLLSSRASSDIFHYAIVGRYNTQLSASNCGLTNDGITIALPKLVVYTEKSSKNRRFDFKPTTDPTGTYNFRLYGHDITITPELLSGSTIATPQLTEQEEYIKKLEAENAALKAENEKLKKQLSALSNSKFCDINGDDLVDVADAQLVLKYYTETVAGLTEDPIEVWYTKRNTITG